MEKIKVEQGTCVGIWLAGWLFTIGFLKLTSWTAVWAIVVWPYYLGVFFAK